MFGKNFVYVLKISTATVEAYKVDAENLRVATRLTEEHTQDNLTWVVDKFKHLFETNRFRLLLPAEEGFLKLYKINALQSAKRQVEESLSIELPEALSQYVYDSRRMGREDDEGYAYHQVMVARKQYLKNLKTIFEKLGLKIEAIELSAFALARVTRKVEVPHLIYWTQDKEREVLSAYQGEVFEGWRLSSRHKAEIALRDLLRLTEKNFGLKIRHAFLTPGLQEEVAGLGAELRMKEEELLHPALGLGLKTDLLGPDKDVLNLTFPLIEAKNGSRPWSRLPIKAILLTFVVIAVLAGGVYLGRGWLTDFDLGKEGEPATVTPTLVEVASVVTVTPETTPTPEPTPTPLNKQELTLQIFNGSGQPGQAAEVQLYLEGLGWNVAEIGNAGRYDYAVTELRIKESKKDFVEELKKDLGEKFTVEVKEGLTEDYSSDAQIILGRS